MNGNERPLFPDALQGRVSNDDQDVDEAEGGSAPPGNRLERLIGDRMGEHGILVNDLHRICFVWTDAGHDEIAIADYH